MNEILKSIGMFLLGLVIGWYAMALGGTLAIWIVFLYYGFKGLDLDIYDAHNYVSYKFTSISTYIVLLLILIFVMYKGKINKMLSIGMLLMVIVLFFIKIFEMF